MSMGGYLAPRAAAYEHRLAACIAYDGVFALSEGIPPKAAADDHDSSKRIAAMDAMLAERRKLPSSPRWALSNALWVFDVANARELLDEVEKYDLTAVASQIGCPTLVCDAENDQFFHGQPAALYEALQCPKTFLPFTAAEGAGEHCSKGALTLFHQRMFDWLDDTVR